MRLEEVIPQGNCHGCGNRFDDCDCEEIDAETNEGKYKVDDDDDESDPLYSEFVSCQCGAYYYKKDGTIARRSDCCC